MDPGASPSEMAARLLEIAPSACWIDRLVRELTGREPKSGLERSLEVWGLSRSEFAAQVGVSRQAATRWIDRVPKARMVFVGELAETTALLVSKSPRHQVPVLVRQPFGLLGGKCLLEFLAIDQPGSLLRAAKVALS